MKTLSAFPGATKTTVNKMAIEGLKGINAFNIHICFADNQ